MARSMEEVPTFNISVKADNLNELDGSILQVLEKLGKVWKREDVKVRDIGEFAGQANRTFVCYVNDQIDEGVVFRVRRGEYSSFVNADKATKIYLFMHAIGVGPEVVCRLPNGLCIEYIKGKSYTVKNTYEFRNLTVAKLVAKELAKVHSKKSMKLAKDKYNMTLDNSKWAIFDWLLSEWDKPMADERAQVIFNSASFPTKQQFLLEKQTMDDVITKLAFDHVVCHNDAHFGNVIYDEKQDRAILIDYDVVAYNNQGFDLAQYLVTSAVGFFAIDRKGEPRTLNTPEFQMEFCRAYLEELSRLDEWGRDVTDLDVRHLYAKVQKMTLYMLLYLTAVCVLIATKPATQADYPPANFMITGEDLWRLYSELKDDILALAIPPVEIPT